MDTDHNKTLDQIVVHGAVNMPCPIINLISLSYEIFMLTL